jgi:hypothetical protein
MHGYLIYYKPYDSNCRVGMHHILFGRLEYKNNRGHKYALYIAGMLDDTPFARIKDRQIFTPDISEINFEELRIFADVSVTETEMDISDDLFKTAKDYWYDKAHSRGIPVKTAGWKKWDKRKMY